jgi:hypothetical protein
VLSALLVAVPANAAPSTGGGSDASAASSVPAVHVSAGGVPATLTAGTPFPLSPLFWGTTVSPRSSLLPDMAGILEATPARTIVWPGGATSEVFDPFYNNDSGGLVAPGQYGGVWSNAATSEAAFVHFCESIGCTAIFQVPGEIDDPAFAASILSYTENTLGFHPYAWEIGNEPELWHYWNVSWSNWSPGNRNSQYITPLQYAEEVGSYITAMRQVDPAVRIIGLPGTGRPQHGISLSQWIAAQVQVNGPNLAALSFHDYPGPVSGTDSLPAYYSYITSTYGLPDRYLGARAVTSQDERNDTACAPNGAACNISIFVTEIGTALSHYVYGPYAAGYPGALDIAAEMIQGMTLNVTNVDLFASVLDTSNSWFLPNGTAQPSYTSYADLLSHLGNEVTPLTVGSATPGINTSLFAVSTVDPVDANRADLLLVNLNVTSAVDLVPTLPGIGSGTPSEEWAWNGTVTGVAGVDQEATPVSPAPVARYLPDGLPASLTIPPQSAELFEAYPGGGAPVTFTAEHLPGSGTRWYVEVDGTPHVANTTSQAVFLSPGTHALATTPIELPLGKIPEFDRHRLLGVVPATISVSSAVPLSVPVNFTEQWAVNLTVSPAGAGSIQPSDPWVDANTTATFQAVANAGYAFDRWQGYGPGAVSGSRASISIRVTTWLSERARFVSGYPVAFAETGLPPGTNWSVDLAGTVWNSNGATVTGFARNGTWAFQVLPIPGFRSAPRNSSVHVASGPVSVPVQFFVRGGGPTYSITFAETGLPSGTDWGVTVRGVSVRSVTGTLSIAEPNGSFGYQLAPIVGWHDATPNNGFYVAGGPLTIGLEYVPLRTTFAVSWNETGLWAPVNWTIQLGGVDYVASAAWYTFSLPNGTYSADIDAPPGFIAMPHHTVVVISGANRVFPVRFLRAVFPVRILESGLPSNLTWSLRFSNETEVVSNASAFLTAANGTYTYDVVAPRGYFASPSHGSVSVQALAVSIPVGFFPAGAGIHPAAIMLVTKAVSVAGVMVLAASIAFALSGYVNRRRRRVDFDE